MTFLFYLLQTPQSIDTIWGRLADHGLTVLLLAVAVVYFYKRDQKMVTKQDEINERMNKYLEEDRREMIGVIQNNTEAFKNFSETLEHILQKTNTKVH